MTRPALQNGLLLLLTMTSGTVDAITFLSLGQVFAAAMTGNTVLCGLAVVHAHGLYLLRYVVALGGFIIGNVIGAFCCSRIRNQTGWSRTLTYVLSGELAILVVFSILVDSGASVSPNALIALLSAAMGIQGVVARRVGVNGITTTVITSTLTGLSEAVVWNMGRFRRKPTMEQSSTNTTGFTPILPIFLWLAAIVAYGVGAAVCGALMLHLTPLAVWVPAVIVFVVIFSSLVQSVTRGPGVR